MARLSGEVAFGSGEWKVCAGSRSRQSLAQVASRRQGHKAPREVDLMATVRSLNLFQASPVESQVSSESTEGNPFRFGWGPVSNPERDFPRHL